MAPQQPAQPNPKQQMDAIIAKINSLAQAIEIGELRDGQVQGIIDQYRGAIYNLELKSDLLVKMLEEKGVMVKEELAKRWPLYLKNDVGVIGTSGKMEVGELKTTFYEGK